MAGQPAHLPTAGHLDRRAGQASNGRRAQSPCRDSKNLFFPLSGVSPRTRARRGKYTRHTANNNKMKYLAPGILVHNLTQSYDDWSGAGIRHLLNNFLMNEWMNCGPNISNLILVKSWPKCTSLSKDNNDHPANCLSCLCQGRHVPSEGLTFSPSSCPPISVFSRESELFLCSL